MARGNDLSFLHVSKPEIDLPSSVDIYDPAVYAKGRENFWGYLKEIDGLLAGHQWCIANQFTPADAYLLVFYRWGNRQKMPVRELANYTAHAERVLARAAVKKVMADEGITLD